MLVFDERGLLPPGDYEMTFNALRESILVVGPPNIENWDKAWRLQLVNNLETIVNQLWKVGITSIFIDGSFVEMKLHPNDIDGYFETDVMRVATGELMRDLNRIEPDKIWTWNPKSRKPYHGYAKNQLPMWHKYRVELYPHYTNFDSDSGITDQFGNPLQFPAAFRVQRNTYQPKGIIKLLKT